MLLPEKAQIGYWYREKKLLFGKNDENSERIQKAYQLGWYRSKTTLVAAAQRLQCANNRPDRRRKKANAEGLSVISYRLIVIDYQALTNPKSDDLFQ